MYFSTHFMYSSKYSLNCHRISHGYNWGKPEQVPHWSWQRPLWRGMFLSEWVSLCITHAAFVPLWFPQTHVHAHSIDNSCTCVPGADTHYIVPCSRQLYYFVRRLPPGNNDKEKRTAEKWLCFFRHIFIQVYLPCRVTGVLNSWLYHMYMAVRSLSITALTFTCWTLSV